MMKQTYLISGIALALLIGGALFAWEKRQTNVEPITPPAPVAPPITKPVPKTSTPETRQPENPQGSQTPRTPYKKPAGWKTYRNEDMGFELKYPSHWFTYDKTNLEKDEKETGACIGISADDILIINHADIGRCVGIGGDYWPGDFLVQYFNTECTAYYSLLQKDEYQSIIINGISAIKYPFTEKSGGPRKIATFIEIPYNNNCYHLEFTQKDKKGNYDPIFDQILSTFKFLK